VSLSEYIRSEEELRRRWATWEVHKGLGEVPPRMGVKSLNWRLLPNSKSST